MAVVAELGRARGRAPLAAAAVLQQRGTVQAARRQLPRRVWANARSALGAVPWRLPHRLSDRSAKCSKKTRQAQYTRRADAALTHHALSSSARMPRPVGDKRFHRLVRRLPLLYGAAARCELIRLGSHSITASLLRCLRSLLPGLLPRSLAASNLHPTG